jgi:parallel beta-helix repeat protein
MMKPLKQKSIFQSISLIAVFLQFIVACTPVSSDTQQPPLTKQPTTEPLAATTPSPPVENSTMLAQGAYYVDVNNGSDTNIGSQAEPWRTIQKAADTISPGGVVVIRPGEYEERVNVENPDLTFYAQGDVHMRGFSIQADHVTISGFTITSLIDNVPNGIGIDVLDSSDCIIENNRFLFNVWGGLRLQQDTNNCVVRNNVFFRNTLYAAEIKGQNHLIESNDVSHTIQHNPCSQSTASWLDSDAFRFHGSGHIFRNNYVHDMPFGPPGYDHTTCSIENLSNLNNDYVFDSHMDCFQTYGVDEVAGHDILFEGNRCDLPSASEWNDGAAKAFQGTGDTYNLTFRNNLIVADFLSSFEDTCRNIVLFHNTFIGSGHQYSQGLQLENCLGPVVIKNNIFYRQDNGIGHIWAVNTPVDAGYNCVYREQGSPSRSPDLGDVWNVDPRLDGEYHLLPDSPCIDAGIDLGVATDMVGVPRPQGASVDMGAFEFIPLR